MLDFNSCKNKVNRQLIIGLFPLVAKGLGARWRESQQPSSALNSERSGARLGCDLGRAVPYLQTYMFKPNCGYSMEALPKKKGHNVSKTNCKNLNTIATKIKIYVFIKYIKEQKNCIFNTLVTFFTKNILIIKFVLLKETLRGKKCQNPNCSDKTADLLLYLLCFCSLTF